MIYLNSEVNFYTDTMIVKTLLSDTSLSKTAGAEEMGSELVEKVKHYVGNQIDPNDRAGSLINLLAPGVLSMALKSMGMGWLGLLLGLAMRVFHIDVASILSSIYNSLKSELSAGKKMTSAGVDEIVQSAVQSHTTPATEEEASKLQTTQSLLRDARIVKMALIQFNEYTLLKEAKPSSFFSMFSSQKTATSNILVRVLGWVFKIAIASAGLMVAGDVINKIIGMPNALDDTIQDGKPVATKGPAPAAPLSTQTKFKVQPSYHENRHSDNWTVNITNNSSSIENMLLLFAKQVYQGLDGLENVIVSTPGFQVVRDRIVNFNRAASGDPFIVIPYYFPSEKEMVDYFIDDVAKHAP